MRQAEKFCRENKPIGVHQYYYYFIHGYDFGIDDYVYISVKKQKLLTHYITFHKLKIYTDCEGEMYINIPETDITNTKHWKNRININDFLVTYGAWDNYIEEFENEQRC